MYFLKTEKELKLHTITLGFTQQERFTEQHNIFLGISNLIMFIKDFWLKAKGKFRIDVLKY